MHFQSIRIFIYIIIERPVYQMDKIYASSMTADELKAFKKSLGLPVTKDIRYIDIEGNVHGVADLCIYEEHPSYPTLKIICDDGSVRFIHRDYLSEMNKSSPDRKQSSAKRKQRAFSPSEYTSDFVVFDIETTGKFISEDEVVEIAAIKIRNGKPEEEFSTFVKPGRPIHPEASALTGIGDDDVRDAPSFREAAAAFTEFTEGLMLIGHNIFGFDLPIIERQIKESGADISIDCRCLDTLVLAGRVLKASSVEDRKLSTLAGYFGISPDGAHRALADCRITREVYLHLASLADESDFRTAMKRKKPAYVSPVRKQVRISEETGELNLLKDKAGDIARDSKVTVHEIENLRTWINEHGHLRGNYPYDDIAAVLKDDIFTPSEICTRLKGIVSPDSLFEDSYDTFEGKTVVLTGDFRYGSKDEVEEAVKSMGGTVKSGVSKKTDCLLVGGLGSERWSSGNYGSKIKKAIELKNSGLKISLITEKAFEDCMNQDRK